MDIASVAKQEFEKWAGTGKAPTSVNKILGRLVTPFAKKAGGEYVSPAVGALHAAFRAGFFEGRLSVPAPEKVVEVPRRSEAEFVEMIERASEAQAGERRALESAEAWRRETIAFHGVAEAHAGIIKIQGAEIERLMKLIEELRHSK